MQEFPLLRLIKGNDPLVSSKTDCLAIYGKFSEKIHMFSLLGSGKVLDLKYDEETENQT